MKVQPEDCSFDKDFEKDFTKLKKVLLRLGFTLEFAGYYPQEGSLFTVYYKDLNIQTVIDTENFLYCRELKPDSVKMHEMVVRLCKRLLEMDFETSLNRELR